MCESCDPFDTELAIHGPGQLRRIVKKLQAVVRSGVLDCVPGPPKELVTPQPPFLELDLASVSPDHIDYHFRCARCGAAFALEVETYHGRGGTWSKR